MMVKKYTGTRDNLKELFTALYNSDVEQHTIKDVILADDGSQYAQVIETYLLINATIKVNINEFIRIDQGTAIDVIEPTE